MVKPQFEVGKERLGKGGVVRDVEHRLEAVLGVAGAAGDRGWGAVAVATSPLPGPAGNIEYFLWLRQAAPAIPDADIAAEVRRSGSLGAADERL
jgi:23S rRNA (cytidine1920-2'-O)/16S rRNA (cytidine1409-2'-O)-methyltransferase